MMHDVGIIVRLEERIAVFEKENIEMRKAGLKQGKGEPKQRFGFNSSNRSKP